MADPFTMIIVAILIVFSFDFFNGFHDAANAIATIVATKVLTPTKAVAMAAVGNFVGMVFITNAIAETNGKGIKTIPTKFPTAAMATAFVGVRTLDRKSTRLNSSHRIATRRSSDLFQDAANAIATIVATKVLTPTKAVAMAAVGNFVGMVFITNAIAETIGKGIKTIPTKFPTAAMATAFVGVRT